MPLPLKVVILAVSDPVRLQREYHRRTAEQYDVLHLNDAEHASLWRS
jgi:hypothetical protein